MNNTTLRPWYKKKRYIIPITLYLGFLAISGNSSVLNQNQVQDTYVAPANTEKVESATPQQTAQVQDETNTLSNSNYYTNTQGNTIHSPAYTNDNSVPAGASAQCRDGTYSFSQSRRGTCSHHGGVDSWL